MDTTPFPSVESLCAGFSADGRRYTIRSVDALPSADSDLWNDRMVLQMNQRGRIVQSGFMQPNMTAYAEPARGFYIQDLAKGTLVSVPFDPVQAAPDEFVFSAGTGDLSWFIRYGDLEIRLGVMLPREHTVELWQLSLQSRSRKKMQLAVTSYFPVGVRGLLAQYASFVAGGVNASMHEYFPYYVKHQDLPRLMGLKNAVFLASDRKPDSYELSLANFLGGRSLSAPAALGQPRLASPTNPYELANEPTASLHQYRMTLAPKGSWQGRFVFGPAKDIKEVKSLKDRYLKPGGFEAAAKGVARFEKQYRPTVEIETPDFEFNHFVNVWLARRTLMLARTIRFTFGPQGRNVIQDAMGSVFTDPQAGRGWFSRIWGHQHSNGWLPHGMPFVPGAAQPEINSIPHRDINSWGPGALLYYVSETGDSSILDEKVPFADKPEQIADVYTHVCMGLEWLLNDRTARGLSRIGQGDWNDPLNMAGMEDRGESVWLSQALSFALDEWAKLAQWRGDGERADRYRAEAKALRQAINEHAWDGQWYVRGFTDAGKPFGTKTDREGKMFINSQSWALISGAADVEKADKLLASMQKHLMTPVGPMTLGPAFTSFRQDIGKITQKVPGTGENGSVYSHAATFYAFALYCGRRSEAGFKSLRTLIPGWGDNSLAQAGQLPLYIPNFYRGLAAGKKFGSSSHSPNTGTAPWYYRTAIAMLMGVRAELEGLRIDPQLPKAWKGAKVVRTWRGAKFDIQVERSTSPLASPRVELDGVLLDSNLVPPQTPGSKHRVKVLV